MTSAEATRRAITGEFLSGWGQPQLGATGGVPVSRGRTIGGGSSLAGLLVRLASKIEERGRSPWAVLQRGFFHQRGGARSPAALARALEHFHVLIGQGELQLLFEAFPLAGTENDEEGYAFDFKTFANALYPKDEEAPSVPVREGRAKTTANLMGSSASVTARSVNAEVEQIHAVDAPYSTSKPSTPAPATPASNSAFCANSTEAAPRGKRRMASEVPESTANRVFGTTTGRATLTSTRKAVDIDSLHTPRPTGVFAKAGASMAGGTSKRNTLGQTITKPAPPSNRSRIDFSRHAEAARFERPQVQPVLGTYVHSVR